MKTGASAMGGHLAGQHDGVVSEVSVPYFGGLESWG